MKVKSFRKVLGLLMLVFFVRVSLSEAQSPENLGGAAIRIAMRLHDVVPSNASWDYCSTLSIKYQDALRQIHELAEECKDSTPMEPEFARDIGPGCREWAGPDAANFWCLTYHPRCALAEEEWYEVSLKKTALMSTCYKRASTNSRNKEEARSALDRERWFYNQTFDLARKWQVGGDVQSKIIETSMNEIKRHHQCSLDELEELIEDMKDFE